MQFHSVGLSWLKVLGTMSCLTGRGRSHLMSSLIGLWASVGNVRDYGPICETQAVTGSAVTEANAAVISAVNGLMALLAAALAIFSVLPPVMAAL